MLMWLPTLVSRAALRLPSVRCRRRVSAVWPASLRRRSAGPPLRPRPLPPLSPPGLWPQQGPPGWPHAPGPLHRRDLTTSEPGNTVLAPAIPPGAAGAPTPQQLRRQESPGAMRLRGSQNPAALKPRRAGGAGAARRGHGGPWPPQTNASGGLQNPSGKHNTLWGCVSEAQDVV